MEIEGAKPKMRTDTVRIGSFGSKVADLRYRPMYVGWSVTLTIEFNVHAISAEWIAYLLNVAGFAVGVGEWRPEKSGTFGMFEVR